MSEDGGGSVMYPPDWEDTSIWKNKASHYILLTKSFTQGNLHDREDQGTDNPGSMQVFFFIFIF